MRKDRVLSTSSSVVAIVLTAALLVMVNWLGYRHYTRADWTKTKLYSLSEKTLNVLKSVKDEVKVIVFMTPSTPLYSETKELLTRYEAANPKIKVEFIDPERDPLRTKTLAQEFGVSAANTVVFAAGDRKKYVSSDQLADYDYSGMQMGQAPRMKAFKGEEEFTSAILGVVNPKVPKIYFTTGHGEHDPDGSGQDGFAQFREALKRDNLDVEKTPLLSGAVPTDCDLLVVAGPTAPFTDTEKTAIKSYLDKGGRLFVMLDPVLGDRTRPSGLEDLLKGYGIEYHDDLVVDPARKLPFFDLSAVYVTDFRSHPVVEGLNGLAVLLPVARSVGTVKVEGATDTVLLTTSEQGWGETNLAELLKTGKADKDPKDTQPPVPLGVAAESATDKDKGWRIVAIGNSAFLTGAEIANAGNLNLGLNAVNWLVKREQALGIAPREPEQVQLFLNASQMSSIALITLLLMPAAAIVLGVVVWLRRRR
jgi:ABC-type uncharacterized transport system involved in gliding motility auxiliary subunit